MAAHRANDRVLGLESRDTATERLRKRLGENDAGLVLACGRAVAEMVGVLPEVRRARDQLRRSSVAFQKWQATVRRLEDAGPNGRFGLLPLEWRGYRTDSVAEYDGPDFTARGAADWYRERELRFRRMEGWLRAAPTRLLVIMVNYCAWNCRLPGVKPAALVECAVAVGLQRGTSARAEYERRLKAWSAARQSSAAPNWAAQAEAAHRRSRIALALTHQRRSDAGMAGRARPVVSDADLLWFRSDESRTASWDLDFFADALMQQTGGPNLGIERRW